MISGDQTMLKQNNIESIYIESKNSLSYLIYATFDLVRNVNILNTKTKLKFSISIQKFYY